MKHLIAGAMGYVGSAVKECFPGAEEYDIKFSHDNPWEKQFKTAPTERYDFCHVCAPSPPLEDGQCDTSMVEDIIQRINADVFICRSTLSPGTTDRVEKETGKNIVVQPEYVASASPYPSPLGKVSQHPFLILGGRKENVKKVRRLYETKYQPVTMIYEVTALEAEIIKLFENTAIANKVTLCQEYYEICKAFNVDYDVVKEGVFGADPRFNRWFTNVYPNKRGFSSSHCLPKDLSILISSCKKQGYTPEYIQSIVENNKRWQNEA